MEEDERTGSQMTGRKLAMGHQFSKVSVQDALDLVFLFADPLVTCNEHDQFSEYIVPLDLEAEYAQIIHALA